MQIGQILQHLEALSDEELSDELAQAETSLRYAQALRAITVRAVHDRVEALGYLVSGATETVAAITVTSTRSAGYLTDMSLAVCDRPQVWSALADGHVDLNRARIIAEGFDAVEDPDREDLEAKALTYAQEHTAFQTKRYVTRLLVDHDPARAEDQRERERAKAWEGRHIGVHPRENGMADIYGCLPIGTANVLINALDEVARSYVDDRTLDQKRVDALGQILEDNVHVDVQVEVVIPADTLTGLQGKGASVGGLGPVDGDYARGLALSQDARWRRLVTDPLTGVLTELSTHTYRIPDALKRSVRARDRVCRFPGCTTAARHTDTDHVVPWPQGPTEAENLVASCRTHHRVKTHSGWQCELGEDGVLTWISPLGTRHRSRPWDYGNPAA